MRLLLAALVWLRLVLVLFQLLWLAVCCPLVVVLLSVMLGLGLGLGLLGLVAAQAAVGVVFGVTVWVGRLQDSVSGAVSIHVGLVGFGRIGDAAVDSSTRSIWLHGEAFSIVADEAVVALLGFTWGAQRVVLLLGWLLMIGVGKRVLLPGSGRAAAMHGGRRLTDCRERIVGVRFWSSLHAWRIRVINLSLGHELAQNGIWVTSWRRSWRRSWGASLAVHSIRISNSVSISISIPKHGVGVIVLLSRRRGSTDGSSFIVFLIFVCLRWSRKSGGGKRVAAFFKKRVAGSRASRDRGIRGTGRLKEHITVETP